MSSGPDGGIGAHGRTTAVHDPRDGNHDDGNHDDGIHDTDWGVFLFTDLEGSTKAWERSPRQMNEVLIEHDRILRDAVDSHGGTVFSWSGDAFAAHFSEIHSAVTASVAAQHVLAGTEWPGDLVPRVRIGIHAGVAYRREGIWFGPCLNRCARIMAAGHGGQILVSEPIASTVAAFDELGAGEVAVKPMGTHRLKDVTEPVELWQLTAPGLIVDFPPLTSITGPADRIPQSRTSFIGRDGDLRQLRELASTERLVTVVAAGGTGKTRLAYETAFTIAPDFNGGTFVVEMADSDADDLAFRTGGAILGDDPLARIEGSTDPLQAAIDHLGSKRCLLVVDNCEHVRHEAAEIVHAITAACPDVHVIATSRVPLGLSGEQVMWLEPLAIGSPDDPGPAVQLFLDRATAVRPDLPLDDAQMDAIKTICRLLDGLPLGVELAAARSTMSLPTEILPKLGDSLRLLRDRKGVDRPERQRSLEATITWSYQQLDELEQRLLQVCSVFAGGFDLDAVCAVGPPRSTSTTTR